MPPARLAFTDRSGRRVVEPGALQVWAGASVDDRADVVSVELSGDVHGVTPAHERWTTTREAHTAPTSISNRRSGPAPAR